jgi:hypothetical protein
MNALAERSANLEDQSPPSDRYDDSPNRFHMRPVVRAVMGPDLSEGYFNAVLIAAYDALSVVPRPFTAAMMASEIPAAIRAYSIAVAPD